MQCRFFLRFVRPIATYGTWPITDQRLLWTKTMKERRHVIDFERTIEKQGFIEAPGVDRHQLNYLEEWQFEVSAGTEWRVCGFISGDTFYIVLLDPNRRLSPTK